MKKVVLCGVAVIAIGVAARVIAQDSTNTTMQTKSEKPTAPSGPVQKSDEEWKKQLTPEQYRVLRRAGTEAPHGAVYEQFKKQGAGTYYCAACGAELFRSAHKFDSHCGWPSFFDASKLDSVKLHKDVSLGMVRTEVVCATCDSHLGHLFTGEGFKTPKDQRYCINGVTLTFVPDPAPEEAATTPNPASTPSAKPESPKH